MVTQNQKEIIKLLKEDPKNDRISRHRPQETQKYAALLLHSDKESRDFAQELNEFGNLWARKYKPKELEERGNVYSVYSSI